MLLFFLQIGKSISPIVRYGGTGQLQHSTQRLYQRPHRGFTIWLPIY